MSTTNALDDRFDDAERGLEWLEKLEALQSRSASDEAAHEVAEYVMKLRTVVIELAGDRGASELSTALGTETARLVEELRQSNENDYWNTRIRPALLKLDPCEYFSSIPRATLVANMAQPRAATTKSAPGE